MPHAVFPPASNYHYNNYAHRSGTASHAPVRKPHLSHNHHLSLDLGLTWPRAPPRGSAAVAGAALNTGRAVLPDPAVPRSFALANQDPVPNRRRFSAVTLSEQIEANAWECVDPPSMNYPVRRGSIEDVPNDGHHHLQHKLTEAALFTHTAATTAHVNTLTSRFSPSPVAVSAFSFSEISSRGISCPAPTTVIPDLRSDYEMVQYPSPVQGDCPTAPAADPCATHPREVATAAPANSQPVMSSVAGPLASQRPADEAAELCPLQPWEDPNPKPPVCTPEYKKMAGHLSEWAAEMVMRLVRGPGADAALTAPAFDAFGRRREYGGAPTLLVDNIRYCLMSTLLQPSVVFLAIYFITKLPVFVHTAGEVTPAAQRFRRTLFGDAASEQTGKNESDLYAPFKAFVNGILLASKTLDDATFSNRVWHDISRIPVQDINALELASLDLLAYDLTVPADEWTAWLELLRTSHLFRAPFPAPIGPVRETPHGAVLDIFNDLINAAARPRHNADEPIFLGIEERIAERIKVLSVWFVVDEDLDEDGPLRDEYRPRAQSDSRPRPAQIPKLPPVDLPPPAEWFPAADPIISRPHRSHHQQWPNAPVVPERQPVYHAAVAVPCTVMDSSAYIIGNMHFGAAYMNQPAYHQLSYYATCCT